MIFAKYKLSPTKEIEDIPYTPCSYKLCDGSGLREVESVWLGGLRFLKCECRKV